MEGKTCVRCSSVNDFNDDHFCMYCGAPLENKCQNEECSYHFNEIILPHVAAFCPECGYETLFKSFGLASTTLPKGMDVDDFPF